MKEISWKEWYDMYKDKKSLNEITCDYNLYCQQYDDYWKCLWLQNNNSNYIPQENENYLLQENGDYLLQENGDRFYL
jgi:hypothetical protein